MLVANFRVKVDSVTHVLLPLLSIVVFVALFLIVMEGW